MYLFQWYPPQTTHEMVQCWMNICSIQHRMLKRHRMLPSSTNKSLARHCLETKNINKKVNSLRKKPPLASAARDRMCVWLWNTLELGRRGACLPSHEKPASALLTGWGHSSLHNGCTAAFSVIVPWQYFISLGLFFFFIEKYKQLQNNKANCKIQ